MGGRKSQDGVLSRTPSEDSVMRGTSLVVQWLRLHVSTAGGMGLIPGQGPKILYAVVQQKQKTKKEEDNVMRRQRGAESKALDI